MRIGPHPDLPKEDCFAHKTHLRRISEKRAIFWERSFNLGRTDPGANACISIYAWPKWTLRWRFFIHSPICLRRACGVISHGSSTEFCDRVVKYCGWVVRTLACRQSTSGSIPTRFYMCLVYLWHNVYESAGVPTANWENWDMTSSTPCTGTEFTICINGHGEWPNSRPITVNHLMIPL